MVFQWEEGGQTSEVHFGRHPLKKWGGEVGVDVTRTTRGSWGNTFEGKLSKDIGKTSQHCCISRSGELLKRQEKRQMRMLRHMSGGGGILPER